MGAADFAWAALVALIVTYEVVAPPGELMSHGWDRYLARWPFWARLVPLVVALHLINAIPWWLDPIAGFSGRLSRAGGN